MRTFLHILGVLGLLAAAACVYHATQTNSGAITEIQGTLSLILTAVCWSGVGIIDAVNKRGA